MIVFDRLIKYNPYTKLCYFIFDKNFKRNEISEKDINNQYILVVKYKTLVKYLDISKLIKDNIWLINESIEDLVNKLTDKILDGYAANDLYVDILNPLVFFNILDIEGVDVTWYDDQLQKPTYNFSGDSLYITFTDNILQAIDPKKLIMFYQGKVVTDVQYTNNGLYLKGFGNIIKEQNNTNYLYDINFLYANEIIELKPINDLPVYTPQNQYIVNVDNNVKDVLFIYDGCILFKKGYEFVEHEIKFDKNMLIDYFGNEITYISNFKSKGYLILFRSKFLFNPIYYNFHKNKIIIKTYEPDIKFKSILNYNKKTMTLHNFIYFKNLYEKPYGTSNINTYEGIINVYQYDQSIIFNNLTIDQIPTIETESIYPDLYIFRIFFLRSK